MRRQTGFPRGELRAQVVELDTEGVAAAICRATPWCSTSTRTDLRGYAWDFPTLVDGAAAGLPRRLRAPQPRPRRRRARGSRRTSRRAASISTRYRLKQFAERGFEPGAEIARPRVLLVGEAAGIDIATGEGIGQAIEYGAVAGPYLARALDRDDLGFADWRQHGRAATTSAGSSRSATAATARSTAAAAPKIERVMPRLPRCSASASRTSPASRCRSSRSLRGAGQFLAACVAREDARRRALAQDTASTSGRLAGTRHARTA